MASSRGERTSDSTSPPGDRDELEGVYTQADGQDGVRRGVEGQYSSRDGHGPDGRFEDTYVGGEADARLPHGMYTRTGE